MYDILVCPTINVSGDMINFFKVMYYLCEKADGHKRTAAFLTNQKMKHFNFLNQNESIFLFLGLHKW